MGLLVLVALAKKAVDPYILPLSVRKQRRWYDD